MSRRSAAIGLVVGLSYGLCASPARADVARHIEEARIAGARALLADSRGARGDPAAEDLARLNQALASELVADLAGGHLTGLESFAKAVEGDRPAGRAAFAPAWAQVKASLRDPAFRARLAAQASRLQWLEWRVEAALAAPGVNAPRRTEAPRAIGAPAVAGPTAIAAPSRAAGESAREVAYDVAPAAVARVVPYGGEAAAPGAGASLTFAAPMGAWPAPARQVPPAVREMETVSLPRVEDDGVLVQGSRVIAGDGPTLVVADFTEGGYRTGPALAAADLLARGLADSGRFRVVRTSGAIASAPGVLVEVDLTPVRVSVAPNPYYGSAQYGSSKRGRRYFPYPYTYSNDVSYAVDARVRVSDLATRARLGEKTVSGFTSSLLGAGELYGYGYGPSASGPAAQVVEQALLDRRAGAARFVLDVVPLTGRVARVEGPKTAVIAVPAAAAVRAGERFVVLGGGGQEVAVLRAQEAVGGSELRVKVSGHSDDAPVPLVNPGDSVVSRGY